MKKVFAIITSLSLSLAVCATTGSNFSNDYTIKHPKPFSVKSKDNDGVKGKIIITAGVGFNYSKLNYTVRYELNSYYINIGNGPVIHNITSTPMINIMADYGIGERVTVGIAAGYQKTVVDWGDDYLIENMKDRWTRIHLAVRGDYRIIAENNIGLYTGVKLGYNMYTMNSSTYQAYDANYINNMHLNLSPVSVQAHFGFSYWFQDVVGANLEVGIGYGGPYFFAAGVTAKF